jgi:hypothetical protein
LVDQVLHRRRACILVLSVTEPTVAGLLQLLSARERGRISNGLLISLRRENEADINRQGGEAEEAYESSGCDDKHLPSFWSALVTFVHGVGSIRNSVVDEIAPLPGMNGKKIGTTWLTRIVTNQAEALSAGGQVVAGVGGVVGGWDQTASMPLGAAVGGRLVLSA